MLCGCRIDQNRIVKATKSGHQMVSSEVVARFIKYEAKKQARILNGDAAFPSAFDALSDASKG